MHGETVQRLREAFKLRKDKQCAIMLDTKGPEIRTGLLKDHKAVTLKKGQDLEICKLHSSATSLIHVSLSLNSD